MTILHADGTLKRKISPTLSTYIHSLFRTYAVSSPNNFHLLPVGSWMWKPQVQRAECKSHGFFSGESWGIQFAYILWVQSLDTVSTGLRHIQTQCLTFHFYEWWPILLLDPWSDCRDAMPECVRKQQQDPFRAWGQFFFYNLSLWFRDLSSSIVFIHCQSGSTDGMVSPVLHSEMSSILGSSNMAPASVEKLTTSVLSHKGWSELLAFETLRRYMEPLLALTIPVIE